MPIAEIGPWEFFVPSGWELKDQGIDVSYLEAPDGTKGMYVKTIDLGEEKSTARLVAAHVQDAHCRGFDATEESDWKIVERTDQQDGQLFRSSLDLLDEEATYRVLSLVVADTQTAVQITVHDYLCEDYEATKHEFQGIEHSVSRVAGAA